MKIEVIFEDGSSVEMNHDEILAGSIGRHVEYFACTDDGVELLVNKVKEIKELE